MTTRIGEAPPERAKRLRLEELLVELGALDDQAIAAAAAAGGAASDQANARLQTITVGEIVDRANDAGFGFVIGIMAIIAIPFFGLSTPFGLAMALCGGQLAIHKQTPWLPGVLRRRTLTLATLDKTVAILARRTRWLGKLTRRRLELFLLGPFRSFLGLAIFVMGVGLALPLPIPGSNMVFLLPIFIYAIGILERDGLLVLVGHLGFGVQIGLVLAFRELVVKLVSAWFG